MVRQVGIGLVAALVAGVGASVTATPQVNAAERAWMYAVAGGVDVAGTLARIDPASGAVFPVGSTGIVNVFDVASLPDGHLVIAAAATDVATSRLYRVNRRSGAATLVGDSLGVDNVNALEATPRGEVFAAAADGTFLTIDVASGLAATVGSYGEGIQSAGDLAFDADGVLYALVTRTGDSSTWLARINRGTGAATLVGSTGLEQVYGLAFGPDRVLYAVSGGSPAHRLVLNVSTGQATLVGVYSGLSLATGVTSIVRESPTVGDAAHVVTTDGSCTAAAGRWTWCRGGSDPGWQGVLPSGAAAGRPVFAMAPGRVVAFADSALVHGAAAGAVLVEHAPSGQSCAAAQNSCWWSAYFHLRTPAVTPGSWVGHDTVLGHVATTETHAHVVTYEGVNAVGGLVDTDAVLVPRPATTLVWSDDAETVVDGWVASGGWARTTSDRHTGSAAWTDSPSGDYTNGVDARLMSPAFSLSGRTRPVLTFWQRFDLERGFDTGRVLVTTDNGITLTPLTTITGARGWHQVSVPLDGVAGAASVRFVFQLLSDAQFTRDGWYLDDLVVRTVQSGIPEVVTGTASPTSLAFAATRTGSSLTAVTAPQPITVGVSGGTGSWTATADRPWISITDGTGTGSGRFTVAITNPNNVLAGQTQVSGRVFLTVPAAAHAPIEIPVTLTVSGAGTAPTAAPIGVFDTPLANATVSGSIAVTGWALDDVGIDRVELWRDLITNDPAPAFQQTGHPANGKVFIANATFIEGTRPDVQRNYAGYPASHRGGWGYLLLTQGFPNSNGTFVLTAIAWDKEGKYTVLDAKTITVDNTRATRPFGSIDVPAYGATFSGHNFTFGWALTPNAGCTVAGGSRTMTIDSVPASTPASYGITYGSARTDIAVSFPGYSDSAAAGGAAALDSRLYPNGIYQIGWLVYDSCGNGEGIGSRFFTILNSASDAAARVPTTIIEGRGPTFSRTGQLADVMDARDLWAPGTAADPLWIVRGVGEHEQPITDGSTVWLSQTGRIEVHATRPGVAPDHDVTYEGYLVTDGVLTSLPLGSSFDGRTGSFYWQPVAGFLGTYVLQIDARRGRDLVQSRRVPLVVGPSADATQLQIDRAMCTGGACVVDGWALDPLATDGSGMAWVHAWATREGDDAPVFLGQATRVARDDVGRHFGAQFVDAGFHLTATPPSAGRWTVTVYGWNTRLARWDVARVVTLDVPVSGR